MSMSAALMSAWRCAWSSASRSSTPSAISRAISGRRRPPRDIPPPRRRAEMASGIRDKVAILGMGCSKFGERWDCEADDLMVEAYEEALEDAGIETGRIEAAWLATAIEEQHVGKSGVPLAVALRLPYIPVTRVENYCASGSEAFRGATYAVASGACDIALALGCEKLKDTGYGGLPQRSRGALNPMYWPNLSAPGSFAQLAAAYRAKHGLDRADLKAGMAHISVKSHDNGSRNPKAHLRNKITEEAVLKAPMIAEPLGLFDCCGVSDGGLKCFGHPIGASGLRMIYEIYLQMQGRAGARQRAAPPVRGLVHNLGGFPHQNVCSIAIIGRQGA